MKKLSSTFILALISILSLQQQAFALENTPKPRIIITADPELDDNNSLIRFLLYATDFNIEGLIYTSSQYN